MTNLIDADHDHRTAELLWDVAGRLVQRVGVGPGEAVLDVACGTGSAAIRAAQAGGRVVGVDRAPDLFDAARARAARARVDVEWVEGDAEALPCADESFDVVLSTFGCPSVARDEQAAREIARVLRRCGRFGLTSWTAPPPRGIEARVRELFADTAIELDFVRDTVAWRLHPPAEAVETVVSTVGAEYLVVLGRKHGRRPRHVPRRSAAWQGSTAIAGR